MHEFKVLEGGPIQPGDSVTYYYYCVCGMWERNDDGIHEWKAKGDFLGHLRAVRQQMQPDYQLEMDLAVR